MLSRILATLTLSAIFSNASSAVTCNMNKDTNGTLKSDSAIIFSSTHLEVDSDGAPNAYRLDGNGLSYTCDGVVAIEGGKRVTPESNPHNWVAKCNSAWKLARKTNDYSKVAIFGFSTDSNNRPIIQGPGDPFPGLAFISTTSVKIPDMPEGKQRKQIDATKIPYIVLSETFVKKFGVKPADVAVAYRPSTGAIAYAVFGDSGRLGEGSVKLHSDLGHNPISIVNGVERANNGIDDKVVIVVFPSSTTTQTVDATVWNREIKESGKLQLDKFGGIARLKACSNDM